MKQMSLLEDSPVSRSVSQEKEKEQMTIDTSGMKLLESLENVSPDGLLAKMLKALLTSTTAWYSDRCKLTWKKKVSKSNVLLFQLQASVHGIKGNESGSLERMWRTPTAEGDAGKRGLGKMTTLEAQQKNRTVTLSRQMRDVDHGIIKSPSMYPTPTQDSASERTKKYSQGGMPLPMAVKMFPTPSASCHMDVVAPPETVTQNNQGWSVTRVGTGTKFGAKLNDVVNKLDQEKLGGKLNPNFVEFLMGFPMNWTKIDPTE